jgi:hypothetical protein
MMKRGADRDRRNVRYWHLVDNPTAPAFVRYWSNSDMCGIVSLAASKHCRRIRPRHSGVRRKRLSF